MGGVGVGPFSEKYKIHSTIFFLERPYNEWKKVSGDVINTYIYYSLNLNLNIGCNAVQRIMQIMLLH